jgi:pyruvate formate lyase activating enzyme
MSPEARWWIKEHNSVRCLLCPHSCLLSIGETGICGVRTAGPHGLELPGYGLITASAPDPVEKKPLYHFHPGETAWSVGFNGCNLKCPFCQNHRIAQGDSLIGELTSTEKVVESALRADAGLVAYTYSEPTVHIEYLMECAETASNAGLKNVLVTNGNINKQPAAELFGQMDAVNVDLKSWNPEYYRTTLGGNLRTVKGFIETALEHCWVEITTLIVPDDNDNEDEMRGMFKWIAELSNDIPLHLSAYHPAFKYGKSATEASTIEKMVQIALEDLNYVYPGNLGSINNTNCPECNKAVIERRYHGTRTHLVGGRCPDCGTAVQGVFPDEPLRRRNYT